MLRIVIEVPEEAVQFVRDQQVEPLGVVAQPQFVITNEHARRVPGGLLNPFVGRELNEGTANEILTAARRLVADPLAYVTQQLGRGRRLGEGNAQFLREFFERV